MRKHTWCWLAVLIGLLTGSAVCLAQERYAVLVGVGQYPHLKDSLQLRGPSNDVRLFRDYLLRVEGFQEDHIVWLSDNTPTRPQRANILAALDDLEARVEEGDFVLLYFAGHGARQPAGEGATEELDGYDEIFLARDVKGWNKAIGSVENAIVDDEIGAFIQAYRLRGVDVWLIFDSCHSGTMTRGVGDDEVRTRKVSDDELGLPTAPSTPATEPQTSAFADAPDAPSEVQQGMLIAFSAAHTSEEAPELPLPKLSEQAEQRGLLTHSLYTVLSRYPGVSYRQLAQLVTDQYVALPWTRSRPQFYGTDMDRTVFNGSEDRPRLFRATLEEGNDKRLKVAAGALRGFDVGAGVAVHANAAGTDENRLGIGTVVTAEAIEAVVEVTWAEAKKPADPRKPVYVQLVQPAYKARVLITLLDTVREADNQRLREIVAALEAHVPLAQFSDGNDSGADYFAAFFEERFWLLRPGQTLPCSVRKMTDEERAECERTRQPERLFWSTAEAAQDLVSRAAVARSLTKLQGVLSLPRKLSIDIQVWRSTQNAPVSLSSQEGPLYAGDEIYYSVHNRGGLDWDVLLFHVDSQFGIQPLQAPGQSVRVLRGEKIDMAPLGTINDQTLGPESLVVIVEPVRDGVEPYYGFLVQESWANVVLRGEGGVVLRGPPGPRSPLQAILEEMPGDPEAARLRGLSATGPQAQVKIFTWTVEEGAP